MGNKEGQTGTVWKQRNEEDHSSEGRQTGRRQEFVPTDEKHSSQKRHCLAPGGTQLGTMDPD